MIAALRCLLLTIVVGLGVQASGDVSNAAAGPQEYRASVGYAYDSAPTSTTPGTTPPTGAQRARSRPRTSPGVVRLVSGCCVAAKGGMSWAEKSGILRDAARGKGNYGLGSGTSREADALGRDWVGEGYTVASDGKTLVSSDGLRQYRPPSFKPNMGRHQANFERKFEGQRSRGWHGNGHLDITDLP